MSKKKNRNKTNSASDNSVSENSVVDNQASDEVITDDIKTVIISESESKAEPENVAEPEVNVIDEVTNTEKLEATFEKPEEETISYGSFGDDKKKAKKEKKEKKKAAKEKDHNADITFGTFAKEFFTHLKQKINDNKKIVAIVSGVAITAVVVVIVCLVVPKALNGMKSVSDAVSESSTSVNNLVVLDEPYEVDAHPEVNELITRYYAARQSNDIESLKVIQKNVDEIEAAKFEVLSNHIDQYILRNCYTKKGPFVNSYIVYATFDVKLNGYEVLAPGLQTFIVCSETDGSLYIYSGDFEPEVANYINEVSAQPDVQDLMKRIKVEYADVLASNEEFNNYMNTFKAQIKTEIGEKIAALEVANNPAGTGDNNVTVSTNTSASFSVKTTTNVNLRKSASENADKIVTIPGGTELLCTAEMPNGWSEVVYDGQTGYIMSSYLTKTDGSGNPTVKASGTVMISETIKIRKEPSTESDSLGVGYAGQKFDWVETLDNGWTKIIFEGQEAYIMSSFIVQ